MTTNAIYARLIIALALIFALAACNGSEPAAPAGDGKPALDARLIERPDLILHNGKILTMDAQNSTAGAIAVAGREILALGADKEILDLAGAETEILDVGGRTIIPGLIDSHIHVIRAGQTYLMEVDWSEAETIEQALSMIAARAAEIPRGEWIAVVGGWHKDQFAARRLPTPAELTQAAPDHPVYVQYLYEQAIMNDAAMAALAIETDDDLPAGATLVRNDDGDATGVVNGNFPQFAQLFARLPKPDARGRREGTRQFIADMNAVGLTGVIDGGGSGMLPEHYDSVFALWSGGELNMRIAYRVMSLNRGNELADLRAWSAVTPQNLGDERLKFLGFGEVIVWSMHDGAMTGEVFTPTESGRDALHEAALWIARNGYTLEIHASSDSGARHILSIFEAINQEVPIGNLRWVICHIDDATPETLERMKALGIGWAVQDRYYYSGDDLLAKLGEERVKTVPPIVTGLKIGVKMAAGTDATRVTPWSPWRSIRWLLDGKSVSGTQIRGAAELPDRLTALRLYTADGAWFSFDEKRRGSLEPGKLADLAVLSDDYMTVPVDAIADITSVLTLVDGRIVHGDIETLKIP